MPEPRRDESSDAFRALFQRNPLPMWIYDSETLAFEDPRHGIALLHRSDVCQLYRQVLERGPGRV